MLYAKVGSPVSPLCKLPLWTHIAFRDGRGPRTAWAGRPDVVRWQLLQQQITALPKLKALPVTENTQSLKRETKPDSNAGHTSRTLPLVPSSLYQDPTYSKAKTILGEIYTKQGHGCF